MKIEKFVCNNCGAEGSREQLLHIPLAVGSERDLASGRSEDVVADIDLCSKCAGVALLQELKNRSKGDARSFIMVWTAKHKTWLP